ncbi:hypothetical protein DL89DRAFT_225866, partial [Linderina pennispora]
MRLSLSILVGLAVSGQCQSTLSIPSSSTVYKFTQPVDHFGANNSQWQQQYLINATFYRPGGPVYMITPGESTLATYYTDRTFVNDLARVTNGVVLAIEHRYYGSSYPMPDLSGASLKYMTPENALEDFASILRLVKTDPSRIFPVPVSANSTIITAGGSYSGAIAAWMRAKYPQLVKGAWASSALIKAQYELYSY